jgi:outer membrane protein assembly factor BamB
MSTSEVEKAEPEKHLVQAPPIRVWPGIVAVVLQWLAWVVVPMVFPEAKLYAFVVGILGGGVAVLVWWLFFSRAPWTERLGAIVLMVVGLYATSRIVHESILGGMMGMMLPVFGIPVLCLALVCGAAATRRLSSGPRRGLLLAAILLACGVFTLIRTGGITGEGASDLHWRWSQTPEQRRLDLARTESAAPRSAPRAAKPVADWPGFRGPNRDGVVRGTRIATDWTKSPPVELWRRPIGPGWSSFAVEGDRLYTQEQLDNEEVVACYSMATGRPVWLHPDPVRFYESNAGPGPRSTPTISNGRVYTCGATGIVNALEAEDGTRVWSCNARSDTGIKVPRWGFAASPLVLDDLVVISTAGRLVAYDRAKGVRRWLGPAGNGGGYSSPHLVTIDGIKQIVLLHGDGAISVAPDSGKQLWEYAWSSDGIVQPALTADGDILIGTGSGLGADAGMGVRRLAIARVPGGWKTQERWTSIGLKPYFNDFVVHQGHAYGFDGTLLACIDLTDGKRKWKGGRYDHGQVILLADQDLLLVLSEKGELGLVAATPEQFRELGRFRAIKGKTWNHPVVAGDIVLTRNDEEMAAFRLARAER